jgi:hypothetical protein
LKQKTFSPINFLGALGAGGIAVAPFAIMQYVFPHPKGLVTQSQIAKMLPEFEAWQAFLVQPFETIMIAFAILHVLLLTWMLPKFFAGKLRGDYRAIGDNPLAGAQLLAPHLAIAMTFNVFIGVARYFMPALQAAFQDMMLPALLAWLVLLAFTLKEVYAQLHSSFVRKFDLHEAHFGWMMSPFALGMVSMVGSGIAALAKNPVIANAAAFFTLMGATGAMFLLVVKQITLMQVHYQKPGIPDRQLLPSVLSVVPILTVLAIVGFRLAHYAHVQLGFHTEWAGPAIVALVFAFQTFYMGFGLTLLRDFFLSDLRRSEYYPALWGLVCPFVAWGVLGAFVAGSTVGAPWFAGVLVASLAAAILLYAMVFLRMISCAGIRIPGLRRVQTCG